MKRRRAALRKRIARLKLELEKAQCALSATYVISAQELLKKMQKRTAARF